jgi:hypothetical protein
LMLHLKDCNCFAKVLDNGQKLLVCLSLIFNLSLLLFFKSLFKNSQERTRLHHFLPREIVELL